jgi:hypothetical protein
MVPIPGQLTCSNDEPGAVLLDGAALAQSRRVRMRRSEAKIVTMVGAGSSIVTGTCFGLSATRAHASEYRLKPVRQYQKGTDRGCLSLSKIGDLGMRSSLSIDLPLRTEKMTGRSQACVYPDSPSPCLRAAGIK